MPEGRLQRTREAYRTAKLYAYDTDGQTYRTFATIRTWIDGDGKTHRDFDVPTTVKCLTPPEDR